MNDDEKFEEFLQREAQSYRKPGDVPREEMWVAIQRARAERRAVTSANAANAANAVTPARRQVPRYSRWIGLAATLVIGVAIGRYTLRSAGLDGGRPAAGATAKSGANTTAAARDNVSYDIVAVSHLSKAEALIAAYGAAGAVGTSDAKMDAQLSSWARDLLSNTRLLLDSPAGADPARRKLLQDLELVLVQIVQSGPAVMGTEDRAQVNRSLERTHVLERLRATQMAGLNSGT